MHPRVRQRRFRAVGQGFWVFINSSLYCTGGRYLSEELSYEELAFHLDDSSAFRIFSRLEIGQYPCKSILQENIKSLSEETWEAIHSRIVGYTQDEKEAGLRSGSLHLGMERVQTVCVEQDRLLQFTGAGQNSVGQGLRRSPDRWQ